MRTRQFESYTQPNEILPLRWNQGRELLDEFHRREQEACGAIGPGGPQVVGHHAAGQQAQSVEGDRRSKQVAGEALELAAVLSSDPHPCVAC